MKSGILKGYIFIIASAVIFGLMPLMAKFIYAEGVNPVSLVLLRNALSLPFLAILAVFSGSSLKIKRTALPSISITALMGCCFTPLLLFSSYNHIPSGTATVFHFVYPAIVMIGEFIFLKSKIKSGHIISVILCVVGISLFYSPGAGINAQGSFLAIISGFTYAAYVICLSEFRHKEISGFAFSFYIAAIASAAILIICLASKSLALPHTISGWLLALLFALSLNVGAVVLFQQGTFLIGGGRASVLSTFEPITSVIAGALIFKEDITAFTLLGTVLVIAACVIIAVNDIKKYNA